MAKSKTSRPAKRTRDPQSKLQALHAAAATLFTQRGYEHVSIANIAKEAGIAVGTVYRFYDNKLALLRAMLAQIETEFVEQMKEDWVAKGSFADRLERVCFGLFALAERQAAVLRLFTMTTDVVFADGSLPGDRIQAQIAEMYKEGLAQQAFVPGDVALHAAMAHGLVEGAMMAWLRHDGPQPEQAARQLAMVIRNGFVAGPRD